LIASSNESTRKKPLASNQTTTLPSIKKPVHTSSNTTKSSVNSSQESTLSVSSAVFTTPLADIHFCSAHGELLAQTQLGNLFLSKNGGKDWTPIGSPPLPPGKISPLASHPRDRDVFMFQLPSLHTFISHDCLNEFMPCQGESQSVWDIQWNQFDENLGLGRSRPSCLPEDIDCVEANQLFLTTNRGKTWVLVKSFVYSYRWAKIDANSEHQIMSILFTKQDDELKPQPAHIGNQRIGASLFLTENFFKTSHKWLNNCFSFTLTKCCLFAEHTDDELQSKVLMTEMLSKKPIWFPVNVRSEKSHSTAYYSVQPLVNMNNFYTFLSGTRQTRIKTTAVDLLTARSSNADFKVSIPHIVYDYSEKTIAFQEIPILQGNFYVANSYDMAVVEINYSLKKQKRLKLANFIQTKITFNRGTTWSKIIAPLHDMDGKPFECILEMPCTLHLHIGSSSQYPSLYSHHSAPGIILAIGNVGPYLSHKREELSTFLSSDAGLTWRQIHKEVCVYEFGNKGGIILLAKHQRKTKQAVYSYDNGRSWKTLDFMFKSEGIYVTNIALEPTKNSLEFLIIGRDKYASKPGSKGYTVSVDFSKYHLENCKGFEEAGSESSDYEKFVPHTYKHSRCFMGRTGYFIRKKPERKCVSPDFNQSFVEENKCLCTHDDWECDAGFLRNTTTNECTITPELEKSDSRKPPNNCTNYYTISQGYRKILNNHCEGGLEYNLLVITCPGHSDLFRLFETLIGRTVIWTLIIIGVFLTFSYLCGSKIVKISKNIKEYLDRSFGSDETKDHVEVTVRKDKTPIQGSPQISSYSRSILSSGDEEERARLKEPN